MKGQLYDTINTALIRVLGFLSFLLLFNSCSDQDREPEKYDIADVERLYMLTEILEGNDEFELDLETIGEDLFHHNSMLVTAASMVLSNAEGPEPARILVSALDGLKTDASRRLVTAALVRRARENVGELDCLNLRDRFNREADKNSKFNLAIALLISCEAQQNKDAENFLLIEFNGLNNSTIRIVKDREYLLEKTEGYIGFNSLVHRLEDDDDSSIKTFDSSQGRRRVVKPTR